MAESPTGRVASDVPTQGNRDLARTGISGALAVIVLHFIKPWVPDEVETEVLLILIAVIAGFSSALARLGAWARDRAHTVQGTTVLGRII